MLIDIDGASVYAYTGGKRFDASLPVVAFVHGAQNDHSVWILQSRYLAHHGYAVLALDLPGHGRSAGPQLTSIEAIADWTLRVIAATGAAGGIRSATIVGHSMGSLVAIEAAARSAKIDTPIRVDRIVAIASAYPMQVSDALLQATAHDEPRAIEMVSLWSSEQSHGGFSQKPASPGPGFGVVWGNRRLMERQAAGVMHADFVACNAYRDGEAAARGVACPALFILGERDGMTPSRSGKALAALVKDATVIELPKVGHAVMAEAPDATLDAIRAFLAGRRP